MSVLRKVCALSVLLGVGLTMGCPSGSGGSAGNKKKDAGAVDAGFDANDDGGSVYCPTGSTTFLLATEASGKTITGRLFDAMPNPPERYNNDWVIDFVDSAGNPIEDVQITKAQTYMPFHQHGRPATWTAMSDPGRFKVALNFFMRGYFEVRLTVSSASAGVKTDSVVFSYCVQD